MQILNDIMMGLANILKDSPALITIVIIVVTVTGWAFSIIDGQLAEQNKILIDLVENQTALIKRLEEEVNDTEDFVELTRKNNDMLIEIKTIICK